MTLSVGTQSRSLAEPAISRSAVKRSADWANPASELIAFVLLHPVSLQAAVKVWKKLQ